MAFKSLLILQQKNTGNFNFRSEKSLKKVPLFTRRFNYLCTLSEEININRLFSDQMFNHKNCKVGKSQSTKTSE